MPTAYQTFAALKLHFTSKYDYFLYNAKTLQSKNFDANKFAMRRDYFHYKKIERYKDELINFIVSNMICGKITWIGDLITLELETRRIANGRNVRRQVLHAARYE